MGVSKKIRGGIRGFVRIGEQVVPAGVG
jgi:hypothetical protein